MSNHRRTRRTAKARASRPARRRVPRTYGFWTPEDVQQIYKKLHETLDREGNWEPDAEEVLRRMEQNLPPLDSLFYTPSPSELAEMMPEVDIEGLEAFLNVPLPLDLIGDVGSRPDDEQKK